MRLSLLGTVGLLLLTVACGSESGSPDGKRDEKRDGIEPKFLESASANAIEGRYIVSLQASSTGESLDATIQRLVARYGGNLRTIYREALRGYSVDMAEDAARGLSRDAAVRHVEQDGLTRLEGMQTDPPWGLDRVDQSNLPLDQLYHYQANGAGVNAYVFDTGIRLTHRDFGGRADTVFDAIGDNWNGIGGETHGTHVAGIIGGETYGVAKGVYLHSVRVSEHGEVSEENLLKGLDYLAGHYQKPAVANLSLRRDASQTIDEATEALIDKGVVVVVAAGNNRADACQFSPGRVPRAITVGASGPTDEIWPGSNHGSCVDLFAPGEGVLSASSWGDEESVVESGTSMAAPHVAGAAALLLQGNPEMTPEEIERALTSTAIDRVLPVNGDEWPADTTQKLLQTNWISLPPERDSTPPTVVLTSPVDGKSLSGTVQLAANAMDPSGVKKVAFFDDTQLIGSVSAAPYLLDWNASAVNSGKHLVTAQAYDAFDNISRSSVTVNFDYPGRAGFDAKLGVPRCDRPGATCDSNTLLVGSGGSEAHRPNTLRERCPEDVPPDLPGAREAIDRIVVSSLDGQPFSPGQPVKVEVVLSGSFPGDQLYLFYTGQADSSPVNWQPMLSNGPLATETDGDVTLSATYTLPSGSLQAVRAAFILPPLEPQSASPCMSGDNPLSEDHDDLVFAVNGGS